MAVDILTALSLTQTQVLDRLTYCIIEPSASRRQWQSNRLALFSKQIAWFESWDCLNREKARSFKTLRGIQFSNELLDAFPVDRWKWIKSTQSWVRLGVCWAENQFQWADGLDRIPVESPSALSSISEVPQPIIPRELLDVLPDGFILEKSPLAMDWWSRALASLDEGWCICVDYGLSTHEFLVPQRANGTLRAFRNHRRCTDPLASPGSQDLTASVDFTRLRETGEAQGYATEYDNSQRVWLTHIFERACAMSAESPSSWTLRQLRQFQTLIHPEHLGRAFRVLVQKRISPSNTLFAKGQSP